MATLFVEDLPEVQQWLDRRRALGQDRRDEVWDGVYHVAPLEHMRNGAVATALAGALLRDARDAGLRVINPFNLGTPANFRGPDLGVVRRNQPLTLYAATAEVVVEVLSPGDESWQKLPHYAAHQVGEVWMVDPDAHTVRMHVLVGDHYEPVEASPLMRVSAEHLTLTLDWPEADVTG